MSKAKANVKELESKKKHNVCIYTCISLLIRDVEKVIVIMNIVTLEVIHHYSNK